MKRRLTASVLFASLAVAPLAGIPASTANAQSVISPQQEIVLSIGRGELVNVPGTMADVFIANDSVADVQVKSQRQLYVFGKAGGETTVYASNARGDIVWSANIRVGSNIGSVDQMLALAMPEAQISVATMGTNTVLLTGTVAAPEDAAEAERLVQAFMGDSTNVISRLKMATPLQVNLQVRFAEVSRSLVRTIGGNLSTFDGSSGFRFGVGNGRTLVDGAYNINGPLGVGPGIEKPQFVFPDGTTVTGPGVDTTGTGATIAGMGRFLGLDLLGALDLAERSGLVTTLSQPNLTALSGETADFLAGGEFPVPISQGLGTTAIEYRKFGVSLAYTPTVLANGRISIRVRPEVSELSSQGAVTLNGFQIPALTIRRAETTIELGSGQSFMIAGLMSNSAQNSIEKAPGVGDLPILGNLFRSTDFRKGETELVIVVTPYLVKPVNANDIKLPTDGFNAPNVLESTLLYQQNKEGPYTGRPVPTVRDKDAPPPEVSRIDPAAVLPNGSQEQRSANNNEKKPNGARQADASAAPGFSLK
ncbi:MAG: type II and III secretion system protein family protein [Sphingomonadaceae bacterium]|nr:type II and III secretion system protein family protein [Sphingomonadaceae bacterium]MCP5384303.1 type II and III secretion system protein family protein [Altererythrobacter sp.]MCP5391401.1 type II and III secretion system protein family protein [Sphingomonadaceae bacterium]MCP5393630.1 type II and III secretion system protein family protein [Sphingomonadaceae bacterium]